MPQEIYKHFKGNIYQILTLAYHSESKEQMVVYQQLYAPFEVYVRPLEMFMSEVDKDKYPDTTQQYRFEKLELSKEYTKNEAEKPEKNEKESESAIEPGLMAFLDADSYERKLEILRMLQPIITNEMIDTMAVSLDIEVKNGDIEQRYNEIKNCLITMERFECNRLR